MDRTSQFQLDDKHTKIAISLYRRLLWTENLMDQFENVFARDQPELERRLQTKENVFAPKLLKSEMYLCLWLGCLYSVIEGWPNLKLDNPRIKQLLQKGYKKKLFDFRNAVFHPVDYDDVRISDLAAEGQKSIDWAREVTNEFGNSFSKSILVFPSKEQSNEG